MRKLLAALMLVLLTISGSDALTTGRKIILFGGGQPIITLSNSSVLDSATVGTVIGTFAVLRGVGSYTFTLTSNPGALFSITGNQLKVAAALTAGSDPITVRATPSGSGATLNQPFTITVVPSAVSDVVPVII